MTPLNSKIHYPTYDDMVRDAYFLLKERYDRQATKISEMESSGQQYSAQYMRKLYMRLNAFDNQIKYFELLAAEEDIDLRSTVVS